MTAVACAASSGHTGIIKLFVEKGADLDLSDNVCSYWMKKRKKYSEKHPLIFVCCRGGGHHFIMQPIIAMSRESKSFLMEVRTEMLGTRYRYIILVFVLCCSCISNSNTSPP